MLLLGGDNGKIYMKEITLQFGGTYMKNNTVVKFFIWFIASLLVLYIVKHMVGIYFTYERNIKAYGLVIIGINIIFGLLILRKLDDLKNK